MKKLTCLIAVAALAVAGNAFADRLELRVVTTGDANTATAGAPVDVFIQGRIVDSETDGLDTEGLALFGVNLTNMGTDVFDLADQALFLVEAPAGSMVEFDRNNGVTNPPGPDGLGNPTGYSGTDDAANGLLQIGGGQNTIGNTGPTVYPIGTVVLEVANDFPNWMTLASGSIDATSITNVVLTLDSPFANTIDPGQGAPTAGSVYNVSSIEVDIVDALTITGGGCPGVVLGTATCPECDINGNGLTTGADTLIIINTGNFGLCTGLDASCLDEPFAADPCADVDGSGRVTGADYLQCINTACFGL